MYSDQESPLHVAIRENDIEVICDLISKGACNVSEKNNFKETPLHLAVQCQNINVIETLLKSGAEVNAKDWYNSTPLYNAVALKNVNITKILIEAGADIHAGDMCGKKILNKAVESDTVEILKLLVDSGADVRTRNNKNSTLLHDAAKAGNVQICKLLLEAGLDVNAENDNEETPFDVAVHSSENTIDVTTILLRAGANANKICRFGFIPFERLIKISDTIQSDSMQDKLRLVLDHTDVNLIDDCDGLNRLCKLLRSNIFVRDLDYYYKFIIEHVAKLVVLNVNIDSSLMDTIHGRNDHDEYLEVCKEELNEAKKTKLHECWVTFFNLLTDDEQKLVKYAGNKNLIEDFENTDFEEKFPIYGRFMKKNMTEGIDGRKSFDAAANILSDHLPIFNPTHLIIRDILFSSTKEDWEKLCN